MNQENTRYEQMIVKVGLIVFLVILIASVGGFVYYERFSGPDLPPVRTSGVEGGTPEVIDTVTVKDPSDIDTMELWTLVNDYRVQNGAQSLDLNPQLNASAKAKCEDMVTRNYWAHDTPDGQEPFVFIDAQGYTYSKAGENLAYGFINAQEVVTGWQISPAHNENLLDPVYDDVGYYTCYSENFDGKENQLVTVQHLGRN